MGHEIEDSSVVRLDDARARNAENLDLRENLNQLKARLIQLGRQWMAVRSQSENGDE